MTNFVKYFKLPAITITSIILASCGGGDDGDDPITNSAPAFPSSSDSVNFAENSTDVVYTASATDAEGNTITYALSGGDDQDQFSIGTSSGALQFKSPPDHENPSDDGGNNVYEVEISASDSSASSKMTLEVTVTNVVEDGEATTAPTKPGSPDLEIVEGSDGALGIDVHWSSSDDTDTATYFQLYQHVSNNPESSTVVYEGTEYSGIFWDVTAGETYYFWSKYCNSAGCSDFSYGSTIEVKQGATEQPVNEDPIAVASSDVTSANEGMTVNLDGSSSSDSDGEIISYAWELISPDVELVISKADEARASFIAPSLDSSTDYIFQLTVTDNDNAEDISTITIIILDSSSDIVPPVANAGSDRGVTEGDSVSLDGSGSTDSDGTIVDYSWELISPDVELTITNANQAQASFTAPAVDADTDYVFRLTVTDDDDASANATVTISIANKVIAPSASAGNNRNVTEGDSVTLDGSGSSDDDGEIISYTWELISPDAELTITNDDKAQASFIAPAVDSITNYIFQITVTDNDNAIDTATVTISILDSSSDIIPPVANAGSDRGVTEGDSVSLDGSGSTDSDGTIVDYSWELISPDVELTITNANQVQASFTAPAVDADTDYVFRLTVTDNDDASANATVTISVANKVIAPSANAGNNRNVTEGDSVSLDGSGSSDSDGEIVSYAWELISPDVELTITDADQAQASFVAPAVDSDTAYVFELTVTDNDNASSVATVSITVAPTNTTPGPENFSASTSSNQVDLSWSMVSSAAGYRVYRDNVLQATRSTTSYSDTTALNGSSYTYSVKAYFSDDSETGLSIIQITLSPNAPTSLKVSANDNSASLSWNSSFGADGYRIYRSGSRIAEVDTLLSYQDSSANNGSTYAYQISSYNAGGESPKSSEVSVTLIPSIPTNLAATTAYQEVILSWSESPGATSYNIYRDGDGNAIGSSDSTSYTDAGVSNDNTYSYSVSAVNSSGESPTSSVIEVYVPISIVPDANFLAEYNVDKNQVELSFSQQDNVSYRLIRSFESDCTPNTLILCDGNLELLISGTVAIDSLDFSQTQYYQLIATLGDSEHIYYAEVVGPDELDSFMQLQSLTVEYNPTVDVVSIGHASSDNTSYTLYAAYEPIGTDTCSIANGIQFCTIPGSSWIDSQIPTAETVDWDKRRYYQLDVSIDSTVVGSLTANAAAADALIMDEPTVSDDGIYLNFSWQELKNAESYTLYLAKDSAALDTTAANWTDLNESEIFTSISDTYHSRYLPTSISAHQLALTAINASGQATPLLHVFLIDDIEPSDVSNWVEVTNDPGWSGRYEHTSVVFDDKIWILGGNDGGRESWHSSDGENWTLASSNSWGYDLYNHTSIVFDGKMWVLGGYSNSGTSYYDDVESSSDGISWNNVDSSADFGQRHYHTSVVLNEKIWVMGGYLYDSVSYDQDVWSSTTGNLWTSHTTPSWSGRRYHTSVTFDGRIWVLGGYDSNYLDDVWYSSDGNSWVNAAPEYTASDDKWSPRSDHTSVVHDGSIWVLGGYDSSGRKNDIWRSRRNYIEYNDGTGGGFDDGYTWSQVTSSAEWSPRHNHTSVVFRDRLWVIGGSSSADGTAQDVWASTLNLDNFTFSQLR